MKKITYFLIAILLFIPVMVNAEECDLTKITIESITVDKATNNIMVFEEPHFEGEAIYLSLSVAEKDDEISYKVVVRNDSTEDYEIKKKDINLDSDYMEYSIGSDNNNIIKAKSTSTIHLRVKYKNEVDPSMFVNGVYQDTVSMKVNLKSSDKSDVIPLNPNTGLPYIIMISIILIISGITLIVYKKKKISSIMILIGILLLPIGVQALCSSEIEINSMVFIRKDDEGRITLQSCKDNIKETTFKYLEGIKLGEYFNTPHYYMLDKNIRESIFERMDDQGYKIYYAVGDELFDCIDEIDYPKQADYQTAVEYNSVYEVARNQENACYANHGREVTLEEPIISKNEGTIVVRDEALCLWHIENMQ